MLEREEVVPRYKSTSPPYYQDIQENEKFEQKVQNFKTLIHYVVEQSPATHGIKMSRRFEPIFVTRNYSLTKSKTNSNKRCFDGCKNEVH